MTRVAKKTIEGGRSYLIETESGRRIIAAIYDSGERELQFFKVGTTTPTTSVRLDDDDARRLGAVLGGTRFRPGVPKDVQQHIGDLVVDWIRIESGSDVVGKTIREVDLHRVTGMSAIAIVRGDTTISFPLSDTVLDVDDRVVVVGQLRQMRLVQDLLTSG